MVRALPHDCAGSGRDRRHDERQGQDREAQRRREPGDGRQVRHHVDPDADAVQERRARLAPGRRRAEAEAGAVDHHRDGLTYPAKFVPDGRPKGRPSALGEAMPLKPPIPPMEATSADAVPVGPEWQYEPKWDGFRCLMFRRGDKVELQSKAGRPLTRYFPDVAESAKALPAKQFVLDGEIVVPRRRAFSFDDLLQRIHPAASRIAKLAQETPALLIVFDLLEDERGNALLDAPLTERRPKLEAFASKNFRGNVVRLSPATTKLSEAKGWLKKVGATLDGIIAKRRDAPYASGTRDAMVKVKNY